MTSDLYCYELEDNKVVLGMKVDECGLAHTYYLKEDEILEIAEKIIAKKNKGKSLLIGKKF